MAGSDCGSLKQQGQTPDRPPALRRLSCQGFSRPSGLHLNTPFLLYFYSSPSNVIIPSTRLDIMTPLQSPLLALWLALSLLFNVCSVQAKDKPTVDHTTFENPPIGLQYFDDSETILVLESNAGILWRSENAGKSWKKASGVSGEVASFWLHPTDNKKAYALGGVSIGSRPIKVTRGTLLSSRKRKLRPVSSVSPSASTQETAPKSSSMRRSVIASHAKKSPIIH